VLLLDEQDRLLLSSAHDREGRPFWFPAGGGLKEGEVAHAAAKREVVEETVAVHVAHEMHAAALPRRVEHPGDRRLRPS
jgi:ADP-ribose pyrophosphatase YjhB (NUDIX family)